MTEIAKVRHLLGTARYATMATVNPDGSPHNSPYLFLYNSELTRVYWGSHPESQHSQNILRTGKLFIVTFDQSEPVGLYIEAGNGRIAEGQGLAEALKVHNTYRARYDKLPLDKSYYSGNSPQKMWMADIARMWTNGVKRDESGLLIQDTREPVTAAELLGEL